MLGSVCAPWRLGLRKSKTGSILPAFFCHAIEQQVLAIGISMWRLTHEGALWPLIDIDWRVGHALSPAATFISWIANSRFVEHECEAATRRA